MKKSRFTNEQIAFALKQAEVRYTRPLRVQGKGCVADWSQAEVRYTTSAVRLYRQRIYDINSVKKTQVVEVLIQEDDVFAPKRSSLLRTAYPSSQELGLLRRWVTIVLL